MKIIKINIILFFILTVPMMVFGQQNPFWQEPTAAEADSLKTVLQSTKNDSLKMYINQQLGLYYIERSRSTALEYYKAQLELAKSLDQKLWEAEALSKLGYISSVIQNYPGSLHYLLAARDLASDPNAGMNMWKVEYFTDDGVANSARLTVLMEIITHIGVLNYFVGNYEKAIEYYQEASALNELRQDEVMTSLLHMNKGESYFEMGQYDLAKTEMESALKHFRSSGYNIYTGLVYWDLGNVYEAQGNYSEAEKYYKMTVATNLEEDRPDFLGMGYLALAGLYERSGSIDSSYNLATKALSTYYAINDSLGLINAHSTLASVFDARAQVDSAYYHMKESAALSSAMNKEERVKEFQVLGLNEQLKLNELKTEKVLYQNRIRMYGLAAGTGVLLLISMIAYRNSRRQKRDKAIIEESYTKLRATQSQLIQQEKLASLGQLTAGIAHEIKNPLNFVNNFSEVSKELLEEMSEELKNGNYDLVAEIAGDVNQNLEKILHHGKRADGIVKGMLEHSRSSSGKKEEINVNSFVDEYLRLAYHGLRAKDKSFNATMKTDFDPKTGKIEAVPQELGRVILNLVTNAFYAVSERKNLQQAQEDNEYEPRVWISTRRTKDQIEIKVRDNGMGIPEEIREKIFQPFFTTKPTGEGTGLGLSLSYDIVKAHGGEIKLETHDGEGTIFTIFLKK
ncbi:ATP-binding protein [Christiangramia fulva]|nr:ATP-binding protein [Christiangramia fulva]